METAHTLHVTVYTKDNCQQCAATERALTRIGLDYREIKINEANISLLQEAGFTQAPVVMVSKGSELQDFWSGYRPDKIQGLLHKWPPSSISRRHRTTRRASWSTARSTAPASTPPAFRCAPPTMPCTLMSHLF
ncbi:hypothetical protein LDH93_07750 [Bifidobacterium pseudolongum]|uniref:glutaredoxin domain-containing protein n=1 Tax=Bifidobacterium pseudolongum TaxID=1694 RepID=UPI001CE1BEA9|nr:hypothetical protein LDH93_07750 [Bifidobacterium pseudolongum]